MGKKREPEEKGDQKVAQGGSGGWARRGNWKRRRIRKTDKGGAVDGQEEGTGREGGSESCTRGEWWRGNWKRRRISERDKRESMRWGRLVDC